MVKSIIEIAIALGLIFGGTKALQKFYRWVQRAAVEKVAVGLPPLGMAG